jgi:LacI family transcriptional regulator
LLGQVVHLGIPVVMADSWQDELQFDVVAQDGFAGGVLAASHLLARGHKRVAFLGLPMKDARAQVIERFGGAAAGLARGGLELAAGACVSYREGDAQDALAQARQLLSARNRPTAVLALWQGASKALAVAARELGLTVGKDFDMVGWSTEEDYAADWMREFPADQVPAAVTWSVKAMADLCITRLMQRRADPKTPVTMTRVPVRLRLAKQEER